MQPVRHSVALIIPLIFKSRGNFNEGVAPCTNLYLFPERLLSHSVAFLNGRLCLLDTRMTPHKYYKGILWVYFRCSFMLTESTVTVGAHWAELFSSAKVQKKSVPLSRAGAHCVHFVFCFRPMKKETRSDVAYQTHVVYHVGAGDEYRALR